MFLGKSGMSGCGSATPVACISTTCTIMSARYGYDLLSLMGLTTQSLRPLGYEMRYRGLPAAVVACALPKL